MSTPELARDVRAKNRGPAQRALRRALGPLPGRALFRLNRSLRRFGWVLKPQIGLLDVEAEFVPLRGRCKPYTMTTEERMYVLWQAVLYVVEQPIPGAIVECGVWRGGSSMLAAMTLISRDELSRDLYLYDTFSGMTEPTEADVGFDQRRMTDLWSTIKSNRNDRILAYASLDEVQRNMVSTGYPPDQTHYVVGPVEETIPATIPSEIAVLRLDTDWYESTRHELEHLWELVAPGGIIIIDDYGDWAGARKAVDEFFSGRPDRPLLVRIDASGRIGVKR
jgi:hypothetical protein